ncbi:MAG: hypothetical protein HY654_05360 [Acidobacteria bacterium]|nr:hypothetical protein [Acidobacteriota bacterium]
MSVVSPSRDRFAPLEAYGHVADLNRRFDDLALGFVDAAIVALAETLRALAHRHDRPLDARKEV